MNTRSTSQASRSGRVQSETGKARADDRSQYGQTSTTAQQRMVVDYPIVETRCPICSLDIGTVNQTIRNHMKDIHAISDIAYMCTLCRKEYETINSVRAHHTACKRRAGSVASTSQSAAPMLAVERVASPVAIASVSSSPPMDITLDDDWMPIIPLDRVDLVRSQGCTDPMPTIQGSQIGASEPAVPFAGPSSPGGGDDGDSSSSSSSSSEEEAEDEDKMDEDNPLRCKECARLGHTFEGKDRIGLVTHMRHKHPNAYEESKTVACKRVAWSNDEDRVLAGLELSLKSTKKGQILNRLTEEYNKLVRRSGAQPRSKEAIRGRRQNAEYRRVKALALAERRTKDDDSSSSSSSDSDDTDGHLSTVQELQQSPSDSASTTGHSGDDDDDDVENVIREYVKINFVDTRISLCTHMNEAALAYASNADTIDPVQLSHLGLQQAIEAMRARKAASLDKGKQKTNSAPPRKSTKIRNARRLEKSNKLAYYQRLYDRNKSKLVSELFDGVASDTVPPPMNIAMDHYRQIWSKVVPDTGPQRLNTPIASDQLLSPITKQEIEWAVKNTKRDSATGPDNVTLDELRAIQGKELHVAFNIWLGQRRIPSLLKMNKTVLLPKGTTGLDNIKNWRPITIASMIIRLYNKILGKRMNTVFHTDARQVGFKPVNGCGLNIAWLHHLLKYARQTRSDLYVCLIDVSKAFDSVPHDSIIRALRRNGAPEMFTQIIADQYRDAYTTLAYKDCSSQKISLLRGVKQGDPLSSILFNLVMDELFSVIKDQYGFDIPGVGKTNARCFADDLALASGSKIGMGELLKMTVDFLAQRGLEVNAQKCISIGLAKGYKGKKSKIMTESLFSINGTPVPMLGYIENTTRYLGIQFTSLGAIECRTIWKKVRDAMDKLAAVRLKPQCKVDLLRAHLIPRFVYPLVHTEAYPKMLYQLDRYVRKVVKNILHLPTELSTAFFYLPIKEGGLQLPVLRDIVGFSKVKLHRSTMLSSDKVLQHLLELHGAGMHERYLHELHLAGNFANADIRMQKEILMKERRVDYAQKVHGAGFEVFSTCPLTNRWLDGKNRSISGHTYIRAIKLRTNTMETKVSSTRGRDVDKTCSRCGGGQESQMHILQICTSVGGMRYRRHHNICHRVARKLREKGYEVSTEVAFPVSGQTTSTARPDIIAIKDGKALVLDVTCVYENSGAAFTNAYSYKVNRYKSLEGAVKMKYDCTQVETHGLVIGSRGSFHHGHLHIWRSIGFTDMELTYLAISCMEDSIRVVNVFRRRED
jgi:hypothetical protein